MTRCAPIAAAALGVLFVAGCCEPLPPKKPTTPEPPPPPDAGVDTDATATPPEIPFVLRPSDGSPSVSFRFVFATGSAEDPPEQRGLTRLTAMLMAEGGAGELTYPELVERLFPMATGIEVSVGRDQTVFSGRVHRDHLEEYYPLIRDVLVAPRLDEQDFRRLKERQRTEVTKTLRGNDDEELGKAALAFAMYAGHPYGAPPLGTATGLAAIDRAAVAAHRERVLCGSRLTVGLAGAFPPELVDRVREDMAALPDGCAPPAELPDAPTALGREVLLVDKPSAESTAISIGFPIAVRRGDADYAALKLVEAYFGQHRTFSGVLQKSLRVQRGFNYGNYAYCEHFVQDGWQRIPATNIARRQQYFSIWIRPVKDADKHFALRLALHELERLVADGISAADLEQTRTFVKRYYRTFAQTEQRQLGYALDDRYYGADGPYFDELFAGLDALTVDDVNAAIRKYLTADDLFIAAVTKDAPAFKRALTADAPSPVSYAAPKPDAVVAEDAIVAALKLGIPADSITVISVDKIFE